MKNKTIQCRLSFDHLQAYRNRDYVLASVDAGYFDALNKGAEGLFLMFSGCIDALDSLPAGSMVKHNERYYAQSNIERGRTLKENQEFYDFMMEE